MPAPTEETKRQSRWQRRVIILVGVLFPLLVAGGVIAPQIITVMNEEEQQADPGESRPAVLDFSNPFPGKTPLRLPRDYEVGFVPELLDLQKLFSGSGYSRSSIERQYARLLGFPRSHGDVIVMDDVDREIADVIFKDPVMVGAVTAPDMPSLGGSPLDDPRPMTVDRYDDPQGSTSNPQAVPEPGAVSLLLFGLIALSYRRRS